MDDPVLHRKFFREKALRLGALKPRRYQLGAGPMGVAPITPEGPSYNPYTTKTVDGKVYSLDRMGNVVKVDYLPAVSNPPAQGMSKLFQGLEAIVDPASASERGTYRKVGQAIFNPETYKNYLKVTNTYRDGVQGLQSDAITQALTLNPEQVGGYLFKTGNETPIKDLYQSIAAAGTLAKKPSNQIIDALRYGYLEAMVNTPENMLKFANDLEQNKAMKNTYDRLFSGTPQDNAIKAMNNGAKLGLVDVKGLPISTYQTVRAGAGVLTPAAAIASGYYFALTPEQQNNMKDNLGSAAIAAGGLMLSQRSLAKVLQDPKGARAITFLSTAKEKLTSPSAFTKIVVEPIANILGAESNTDFLKPSAGEFDVSDIPIR